jgi:catechol 2,3-dioxygenase-like lactoylglutathione lyase family enzyme
MFADSPCRPTIAVRDKVKALEFYRDVLGFKLVDAHQPGASFACGGGTFLEIYPSEFAGTAKSTVAGFQVADLEATILELRSRGVTFEEYDSPRTIDGIAQLGPNRGAWFKDPDGNTFALVQLGSP